MRPPAFQLSSHPIQRHVPQTQDDSLRNLTAESLHSPAVLERLSHLSSRELNELILVVNDTAVRDHLIRLQTEAQARVPLEDRMIPNRLVRNNDGQVPHDIEQSETNRMRNELLSYISGILPRMHAFLANPPHRYRRFRNNASAEQSLALLQRAVDQVRQGNLLVLFTNQLDALMQAAYGYSTNFMRLRPFSNRDQLKQRVGEFAHEFTHSEQDAAMEERVAQTTSPIPFSGADDLAREVGGWRSGSYITHIMMGIGELHGNANEEHGDFFNEFENAQHGDSGAIGRISEGLSRGGYDEIQIRPNMPSAFIRAELVTGNHVHAFLRGGETDLGEIRPTTFNEIDFQYALQSLIYRHSDQAAIFGAPGTPESLNTAVVMLYRNGRRITELVARNPTYTRTPATSNPQTPAAHP